jgi:GT2 family glycosyltransferase
MRFSVVIATKGRPEELARTLAGLSGCEPAPDETIIVDGDPARSARPVAALAANGLPVHYVESPPGLTRQRNEGVRQARGEVIVFLDDDVDVDPGLFAALERGYRDPGVVGATGRVIEEAGRRFGNKRSVVRPLVLGLGREGTMTSFGYPRRPRRSDRELDVEFMQGCLMSGRREAVARVGFDERLPGYALAEDEDFSYRLSRLGRVRYLPGVVVRHKNTGFRSSQTREFNRSVVVNRAYLFRKNFRRTPAARLGFAALVVVLIAHRAANREWNGVRGLLEGSLEAWQQRP